ncbi:DUF1838 family protein [Aurantiacibacter aquimixticola]|uniref:DUF1838 domain-containing protein n=1 Tax=Aurantiacibacter aquimixticola TaxID=1958945 RepID=A0A419RW71_9SPHN|nr:DUF1838 family protein [Aurantiacibacter aquimixticola]RJY10045.1 DUF1838 domain-containing protein [Aurantiacibacter aquimixticola]
MKTLLGSLAITASALVIGSVPSAAQMLDPSDPDDYARINARVQCGAEHGDEVVYGFSGNIYARVPGERDRLLFRGEGMNVRRCLFYDDPVRGPGYRIVSREVLLYLDPQTGEVVDRWDNPWTGETVDVMQVHNDPVNNGPSWARDENGDPARRFGSMRVEGDYVFMPFEVPLFYRNPLGGDYQDSVGNMYHAMEIFDFAATRDELFDPAAHPVAYPMVSWVRISQWMPWMEMGGRPGLMVFNFMGSKLEGGFDELPDVMKDEIRENYPIYESAPPLDDTRPNETTWTKFKLLTDQRRAAEGGDDTTAHSGH